MDTGLIMVFNPTPIVDIYRTMMSKLSKKKRGLIPSHVVYVAPHYKIKRKNNHKIYYPEIYTFIKNIRIYCNLLELN